MDLYLRWRVRVRCSKEASPKPGVALCPRDIENQLIQVRTSWKLRAHKPSSSDPDPRHSSIEVDYSKSCYMPSPQCRTWPTVEGLLSQKPQAEHIFETPAVMYTGDSHVSPDVAYVVYNEDAARRAQVSLASTPRSLSHPIAHSVPSQRAPAHLEGAIYELAKLVIDTPTRDQTFFGRCNGALVLLGGHHQRGRPP